jgi:hypothetical protein
MTGATDIVLAGEGCSWGVPPVPTALGSAFLGKPEKTLERSSCLGYPFLYLTRGAATVPVGPLIDAMGESFNVRQFK